MLITELFAHFEITKQMIDQMSDDIEQFNEQSGSQVPVPELLDSIDKILYTQLPFIGRAIGKVKGIEFMDGRKQFPLTIDENATIFAFGVLSKFYKKS